MEKVPLHGSLDQPVSSYKSHIRKPRKIHQLPPFISRPYEDVLPSNIHSMGLLRAPPPFIFHSYPSSYSLQKPPQPPLLPLPAIPPRRVLSCPPANRNRDQSSLTRKKTKSPTKKEEKKLPKKPSDAKELPRNVAKVSSTESMDNVNGSANDGSDAINGMIIPGPAVFKVSPPPSSLPLPSFCLRPKLSCNAEAAGVDAGATDDLRQLLRLR